MSSVIDRAVSKGEIEPVVAEEVRRIVIAGHKSAVDGPARLMVSSLASTLDIDLSREEELDELEYELEQFQKCANRLLQRCEGEGGSQEDIQCEVATGDFLALVGTINQLKVRR